MKRNSIVGFFVGVVLTTLFMMLINFLSNERVVTEQSRPPSSTEMRAEIDTIIRTDSSHQIIKFFKNGQTIDRINFFNYSKEGFDELSSQEILFYQNGTIKCINIVRNSKLDSLDGYVQVVNQTNFIEFSEMGALAKCMLMDSSETILEYPRTFYEIPDSVPSDKKEEV